MILRPGSSADLTINEVSRLLGVPAPTLRSWERRYGVPVPSRTPGRHRRYGLKELEQLRRLRDEISRGRSAAEAAQLVAPSHGGGAALPSLLVERFLEGSQGFDTGSIRNTLDEAVEVLGVERAIADVALPAMRQVGSLWQVGRCDVANEHLATDATRAWLSRLRAFAPPAHRPGPLVLACGPTDLHSVGLESFAALLSYRGWDCRVLGPITPVASLVRTVLTLGAAGAVITSHRAVTRRGAIDALRALAGLATVSGFYGGNGFVSASSRQGVPGTYLGDDIPRAADVIERTIA